MLTLPFELKKNRDQLKNPSGVPGFLFSLRLCRTGHWYFTLPFIAVIIIISLSNLYHRKQQSARLFLVHEKQEKLNITWCYNYSLV